MVVFHLPSSFPQHSYALSLKMSAVALVKEVQLLPQPGSDGTCGPAGFFCHVCFGGL